MVVMVVVVVGIVVIALACTHARAITTMRLMEQLPLSSITTMEYCNGGDRSNGLMVVIMVVMVVIAVIALA